jgi:hypothetical protein
MANSPKPSPETPAPTISVRAGWSPTRRAQPYLPPRRRHLQPDAEPHAARTVRHLSRTPRLTPRLTPRTKLPAAPPLERAARGTPPQLPPCTLPPLPPSSAPQAAQLSPFSAPHGSPSSTHGHIQCRQHASTLTLRRRQRTLGSPAPLLLDYEGSIW